MSEVLLTIIILTLIGLIIWREIEHAKQIKELLFLIKSQEAADYEAWKATEQKPKKPEPDQYEQIEAQDLTPEEVKQMTYGG